jgi:hypothetical protein
VALSINRLPVILSSLDPRLKTGTIPGTKIKLRTRRYALPLFLALAAEYGQRVAPLREGEVWSWNARQARASSSWSDHASGTAIDLNSAHEGAQGPRGGMATMSKTQINRCVDIKRRYRVVIWGGDKARGGDYSQPRYWDPMHYALKPGTTKAEVMAVIKALGIQKDGTFAPKPVVKPTKGKTVVTSPTIARKRPSLHAEHVGREKPKGTSITYVAVVKAGGETWLKTRFGNYYLAKRTARGV